MDLQGKLHEREAKLSQTLAELRTVRAELDNLHTTRSIDGTDDLLSVSTESRQPSFLSAARLPNFAGCPYEDPRSWIEKLQLASEHLLDRGAAIQFRFKVEGGLWSNGSETSTATRNNPSQT